MWRRVNGRAFLGATSWVLGPAFARKRALRKSAVRDVVHGVCPALNPDVVIMVGGSIFVGHPEFQVAAGADFTAQGVPSAMSRGVWAVIACTSEPSRH